MVPYPKAVPSHAMHSECHNKRCVGYCDVVGATLLYSSQNRINFGCAPIFQASPLFHRFSGEEIAFLFDGCVRVGNALAAVVVVLQLDFSRDGGRSPSVGASCFILASVGWKMLRYIPRIRGSLTHDTVWVLLHGRAGHGQPEDRQSRFGPDGEAGKA